MNKFCVAILIFILGGCSFFNNDQNIVIKNEQGQQIYVKIYNEGGDKLAFVLHGLASNMEHQTVQTAKQAFIKKDIALQYLMHDIL